LRRVDPSIRAPCSERSRLSSVRYSSNSPKTTLWRSVVGEVVVAEAVEEEAAVVVVEVAVVDADADVVVGVEDGGVRVLSMPIRSTRKRSSRLKRRVLLMRRRSPEVSSRTSVSSFDPRKV
jgi:hypothetical protein